MDQTTRTIVRLKEELTIMIAQRDELLAHVRAIPVEDIKALMKENAELRAECAVLKADYQRWTEYATKWKSVSEIIASEAVLRSTLEKYACSSMVHEWGRQDHPCYKYMSCETLSASSGEALAAVRGAMRTLDDVDGAFSNNNAMDFEDIPRALAELKRVFGDAAEDA